MLDKSGIEPVLFEKMHIANATPGEVSMELMIESKHVVRVYINYMCRMDR
jgi:hypothetical protein